MGYESSPRGLLGSVSGQGYPTGQGILQGVPALILSLVALFFTPLLQRGLRFVSLLRCAGPWVVRPCLPPVVRAHPRESCNFLRARLIGFYHRVGAPTTPTVRGSGPSLCPAPMPQGLSYDTRATSLPILYRRKIIPGDMGPLFWSTWPYRGGVNARTHTSWSFV
jgi:hypothetical protein